VEDIGETMKFIISRLKEGSTWRGLVWLLTVCGVLLTPEQIEAIVLVGMAVAGLLGVFISDKQKIIKVEPPSIDESIVNLMRESTSNDIRT